jgi:hypothetical protein
MRSSSMLRELLNCSICEGHQLSGGFSTYSSVLRSQTCPLQCSQHPIPAAAAAALLHRGNLKSNSVMRLATATVVTISDYC